VRLFRSRHPQRPVIPVIVEGTYPDNFPPALRCAIAADGSITEEPITILGPDLRESGDGKALGLAKVVAGLIGIGPDDVFRRAERARRRQARVRNGIAGMIVMLTASGGFFAWQSHETRQTLAERQSTLDEIEALVARYSPAGSAQAATPGAGLTAAITAIANGAATDARYAKALELLKAGRPAEAEPLLKAIADEMATRAKSDAKQAAEAYRNLGAIAGLADPKRAREYYARALEFDPDNVDALFWAGWIEKEAGYLDAAERRYRRLVTLKADAPDSREIFWAWLGLGDIRVARGDLDAAMSNYRNAQTIAERATKADPDNVEWQRNLSVSYDNVGDLLMEQGESAEALASYRTSLTIAERLAKTDPDNTGWQQDLSVSYDNVGNALVAQGDLTEALTSYRASIAIRERLTKTNPSNAAWQRILSVSYTRVGDVLVKQDDLAEAIISYRASLAIRERLAQADPNNLTWQHDLSESYSKIGDALRSQDNLDEALTYFRQSIVIAERLAKADPDNVQWQWDMVVSHWRLAMRGDEPGQRWAFIVAELRKLKDQNRLRADREQFLPQAEQELAKYQDTRPSRR
jgi:tetratricopeptide (TPR) repeat protein